MSGPDFSRLVRDLPASVPFVGPEALERARGAPFVARLGANESLFGPSPRAVAAMVAAAGESFLYGDPEIHDLRGAIARHHGVDLSEVRVGEGIDGLLAYLLRLVLNPGDGVVTSDGAYPTFNYHVAGLGGVLHKVPYRDDRPDLEAMRACFLAQGARVFYLANPDNPMGGYWSAAEIARLIADLPAGCLVILDEAYADTAPEDAIAPIDCSDPRLVRLRTFSKAYGLAGLRVGYVLGAAEFLAGLDRIRHHFGMGRMAQAGALAALQDQAYLAQTIAAIAASRARIAEIAAACGLRALPSATNFVAVDCGRDGGFARAALGELAKAGVFARMPMVAPLDRCLRISAGGPREMDILAEALPRALSAVR